MGTRWSARLVVVDAARLPALYAGIQQVFDGVVAEMSNWEPASDISRFNRSPPGQWQTLPPATMTVLRCGLDIAARSDGAFDPAIGALVAFWGFGPDHQTGSALRLAPAWRAIEVDGPRARRTANVALDFSGIAKGHAVDAVADWLRGQGYQHFLVEAGGELRGEGLKPDGQPWWVDLEAVPGLALPPTRIALCGFAIATSGDYRRFRLTGNRRDSHSIDPRSGAPIRNNVASVTVIGASAMHADAWATALTVLGQEAGMALAIREQLAALIVTRTPDGATEAQSPAFTAMLG
ncbi:FAD:protein FMN transferase [Polymorphobacter sp.]|uniref:FAD:protein FMN transferase n=1 Tax=Polymorphobacter sp. TaxID=1909290 RepID=UPI003F72FA1C